jgi:prevent-host-death family protein
MKFINTRDLRQRSAEVLKSLQKDDYIITSNGKPIAVLTAVDDDLDLQLQAIRRARAELAVFNMQKSSLDKGLNQLSNLDLEKEITEARMGLNDDHSS